MDKHISDFTNKQIIGSLIATKDPYVVYEQIDHNNKKDPLFYSIYELKFTGLYRALFSDKDKDKMINLINNNKKA